MKSISTQPGPARSPSARPVLRLVPPVQREPNQDLVQHLTELLEQAKAGEIDGAVFACRSPRGWDLPVITGSGVDDLVGCLGALSRANQRLCAYIDEMEG